MTSCYEYFEGGDQILHCKVEDCAEDVRMFQYQEECQDC